MNPKSSLSPSFILLSFFLIFSSATAFNITKLLGRHPEFSTFNGYLTETQLAAEINRRQTITVLAVGNRDLSSLSGKPIDVIKNVLSLHVVLDYYDVSKLQSLTNKTALLTTLFQSSGQATDQRGFLNVTDLSSGEVVFGSAVKDSPLTAKFVKSVAAQPYNISVLHISSAIEPAGIDDSSNSTSPPPPSASPAATPQSPSPSKPPRATSPTKAPAPAPPKTVTAPSPSDDADAPSDATAPSDSDAPAASDAPVSSPPSPSIADGPTESNEAGAPAPSTTSSGTQVAAATFVAVILLLVSSCFAL